VLLGEECKAMMSYLAIEKSRFQDNFTANCQIEDTAREVAVPGHCLATAGREPVKYGRQASSIPLQIKIRVFCPDSESVRIEVSNSGNWTESKVVEKPGGVGLGNSRRRLELL
jgi:two-component system, LytTR family, sensor kinase